MMLLRDVLVTKRKAAWLEKVIILSIPVFNPDGHEHVSAYNRINENGPEEMGFRVTARRLNLNRDYVKADAPEMRAWLKLYSAWLPDFLIDNHVTDGSDNQYDVTIAAHTEQDIAPEVGSWVRSAYLPELEKRMAASGHIMGWYAGFSRAQGPLPVMTASPRYSTGYSAARNRASLLVETHSLKSFRTRVWSHYDIMSVTLDVVAGTAGGLRSASVEADRAMERMTPGVKVFLEGTPGGEPEATTLRLLESERYSGTASGASVTRYTSRPLDRPALLLRGLREKTAPTAPSGYIVPRPWTELIEVLRVHGVKFREIPKELRGEFDSVRFGNAAFAGQPFEGRFMVTGFTVNSVKEQRTIPSGSVYVPVAQQAGKLVMHLLEPEAPDSAIRWGFFNSIFEQKEYFSDYVFEPYAARMLETESRLREEFQSKLKSDPAFAANPRARLTWLYQRSPYQEPDKDAYPVVKVLAEPR